MGLLALGLLLTLSSGLVLESGATLLDCQGTYFRPVCGDNYVKYKNLCWLKFYAYYNYEEIEKIPLTDCKPPEGSCPCKKDYTCYPEVNPICAAEVYKDEEIHKTYENLCDFKCASYCNPRLYFLKCGPCKESSYEDFEYDQCLSYNLTFNYPTTTMTPETYEEALEEAMEEFVEEIIAAEATEEKYEGDALGQEKTDGIYEDEALDEYIYSEEQEEEYEPHTKPPPPPPHHKYQQEEETSTAHYQHDYYYTPTPPSHPPPPPPHAPPPHQPYNPPPSPPPYVPPPPPPAHDPPPPPPPYHPSPPPHHPPPPPPPVHNPPPPPHNPSLASTYFYSPAESALEAFPTP